MGTCTVCRHPDLGELDKLLAAGVSLRSIAKRYGVALSSLQRHKKAHVKLEPKAKAIQAQEMKAPVRLADIVGQIVERTRSIWDHAEEMFQKAKTAGQRKEALAALRVALEASREVQSRLEFAGRVTGELRPEGPSGIAVIVVPALVPVGSPADLKARIPPEAVRAAITAMSVGRTAISVEPRSDSGEVQDAEWEDIPAPPEQEPQSDQ